MQTSRLFPLIVVFTLLILGGTVGASNLTLSKAVEGGTTFSSGENITWTLTVVNHNQTAGTDVNITEQVPPGCSIVYLPGNGTVTDHVWTIHLDPGASDTLKFNMTCTLDCGSRPVVNQANITSPEPGSGDNPDDFNDSGTVTITAPQCTSSNLSLEKTVNGKNTYNLSEKISWLIKVTNHNISESIPVNVTDTVSPGCTIQDFEPSTGEFNDGVWSLQLAGGASEALYVNVTCTKLCGSQIVSNTASITSPSPSIDDNPTDNNDTSQVTVNAPACANVTVRPITLNLKSKGVLTVFFTVGKQFYTVEEEEDEEAESAPGIHVDREASSLACNGVNASNILFSMKDGGTVIGKFQRQALALEATDGTAQLDCDGTIRLSNGEAISIQGNTTIKVIHPGSTQKQVMLQRILALLNRISDWINHSENANWATTAPVDVDQVKNLGQANKILKNVAQDNQEDESEERESPEVTTIPSIKGKPEHPGNGNGKRDEAPGQNKEKGKGNS
jgi:hypothetical protein